jgi:hypothetical protein
MVRPRFAICSGLHALAQRRSARGPCRRPVQRTSGPGTAPPSGLLIAPASRSCTYSRSSWFAAGFAILGRRARRSACHWAVAARYSSRSPRVPALRRSSREIVDGARPVRFAISRTPHPPARKIAISSRSANDKCRPDTGTRLTGRIPLLSRNHCVPTAGDTPASMPRVLNRSWQPAFGQRACQPAEGRRLARSRCKFAEDQCSISDTCR